MTLMILWNYCRAAAYRATHCRIYWRPQWWNFHDDVSSYPPAISQKRNNEHYNFSATSWRASHDTGSRIFLPTAVTRMWQRRYFTGSHADDISCRNRDFKMSHGHCQAPSMKAIILHQCKRCNRLKRLTTNAGGHASKMWWHFSAITHRYWYSKINYFASINVKPQLCSICCRPMDSHWLLISSSYPFRPCLSS